MDSNRAFRGAVAAVIAAAVLNGTAAAAQAIAEPEAASGSPTADTAEQSTPLTETAEQSTPLTETAEQSTPLTEAAEPASTAHGGIRPRNTATAVWSGDTLWSAARSRVPVWTRAGLAATVAGAFDAARTREITQTRKAVKAAKAHKRAPSAKEAGTAERAASTARAVRAASGTARKGAVVHRGTWRTSARPNTRVWAPTTPKGRNKAIAYRLLTQRAWPVNQFRCLDSLWTRESNWNHRAQNPSSGAYGIPQALPGRKMVGIGHDWRVNPATQIRWGLKYIKGRYGSPCGAWGHFRSHNWY
ncbi:hypothetical protein [Sphaerisporangium dianthi]|uniref:Lytic transglycosylase domain-containing protein n=1 Tax=Sphaerisporangium dianthi TaxID=1436120 RepID=A0ABV9CF74_9ACTN